LDEVEEDTKKRVVEVKNGRGVITSKIIEFKKWRMPWLTENHVKRKSKSRKTHANDCYHAEAQLY
jgi:hypothetical protein